MDLIINEHIHEKVAINSFISLIKWEIYCQGDIGFNTSLIFPSDSFNKVVKKNANKKSCKSHLIDSYR